MSNFKQLRPFYNSPVAAPAVLGNFFALPNLASSLGGPPLVELTLFAHNPDNAPQVFVVDVQGVSLSLELPANSTVQVFDAQPFVYLASALGLVKTSSANGTALVYGSYSAV